MQWGKVLTQATFAFILAMMVILPLATYGCLKLKQAAPPESEAPAGENVERRQVR